MRLVTSARITFPEHNGRRDLVMRKITGVRIECSRKNLTDTAEIVIPRNTKFFDINDLTRLDVTDIFRTGDPVYIELGYGTDDHLVQEFTGYVCKPPSAGAKVVVISCEDEMYHVKKTPVNFSAASITLADMLKAILPGYEYDAEYVNLGGIRLSRTNAGTVLEELTSDPWNLDCYMRGKTLYVESKERADLGKVSLNMERDLIDDNLNYRKSEEVVVKIKATSVLVNGQKIEFTIGEDGGDEVNLTYYNIEVEADIEAKAKADYARLKKDGFDGTIKTEVIPSIEHGQLVTLDSRLYPDRNGSYYAETVIKDFEPGNYTQTITIGRSA